MEELLKKAQGFGISFFLEGPRLRIKYSKPLPPEAEGILAELRRHGREITDFLRSTFYTPTCPVCNHPERKNIEYLYDCGMTLKYLCKRFNVSSKDLGGHLYQHRGDVIYRGYINRPTPPPFKESHALTCPVCNHPEREKIEHLYNQGMTLIHLCKLYSFTPKDLTEHLYGCTRKK